MSDFSTEWLFPVEPLFEEPKEEGPQNEQNGPNEQKEPDEQKENMKAKVRKALIAVSLTVGIACLSLGIIIGYGVGYSRGEANAAPAPAEASVAETESSAEESEDVYISYKTVLQPDELLAELKRFFNKEASAIDLDIDDLQETLTEFDASLVSLAGFYEGTVSDTAPAYAKADIDNDGSDEIILKAGSATKGECIVGVMTYKGGQLNIAKMCGFEDVKKSLGNPGTLIYDEGMVIKDGKLWFKLHFDYASSTDYAWVAYELNGISFKLSDECYVVQGLDSTLAYHLDEALTLNASTKRPNVPTGTQSIDTGGKTGVTAVDALLGEDTLEWISFIDETKESETENTSYDDAYSQDDYNEQYYDDDQDYDNQYYYDDQNDYSDENY